MPNRPLDIDTLLRSPLFAAARHATTTSLLARGAMRVFARGSLLFEQNGEPTHLHVVAAGSVGLRAHDETGAGTIIDIFGPGQAFVVPSVMLGLPYPGSGVALTEAAMVLIPAPAFREAVATDPGLNRATVELLSRHWRLMVDQLVDLKLRPAEKRVARFLARRVPEEAEGGPAELPEPRTAIAARLGMTPETLSRALAALEARGLIRLSARRAHVLDRARLLV